MIDQTIPFPARPRPITPDIVAAAQRAQAAYFTDRSQSKAVFEHLGYTWLDMWQNASSQAVLSIKDGLVFLSISGTRASAKHLEDIFLDVDLTPLSVQAAWAPMVNGSIASNGQVTTGAYADMKDIWAWAQKAMLMMTPSDDKPVFNVDGHSLGGARAQLTPLFLPKDQIGDVYSFESPKFAETNYFQWALPYMPHLICTLNGADGWAAWPWNDAVMIRPPIPHLWLKAPNSWGYDWIEPHLWPGGMDFRDHDIDTIVDRLAVLASRSRPQSISQD
jgi:hypothetical protein